MLTLLDPQKGMNDMLQSVGKHIEFYGYDVKFEEDILFASHQIKLDFAAWAFREGILFRALVPISAPAKTDPAGFYAFLNLANRLATVARFLLDEEYMAIEAWCPSYSDKKPFAAFFDQFTEDMRTTPRDHSELVNKYFS